MNLSIVVPCYNESGNIPLIVEKFNELLIDHTDIEVLLVDNGSTDNSQSVFTTELGKLNHKQIRVVTVENNQGYGHGILSGLNAASGKFLAWTHADLQTDPADVLIGYELLQKCDVQKTIIKGKRRKRKLLEGFFTFGMQVVAFVFLKKYLDDINAQPKIFSREFFDKHIKENAPLDFSLDLYLLYQAKTNGFEIKTFPVFFNKRIHGEAKGGGSFKTRIKLIQRTLAYIQELAGKIK